jgi:hypothetical protein
MTGALNMGSQSITNIASGSAASPSLRFTAGNGFYLSATDTVALSLGGTLRVTFATTGVTSTGSFTGTDFTISSDERKKTGLSLVSNHWAIIDGLNGYKFTYKETGRRSIGFIAQEVEAVAPELVTTDDEGFLSVS